MAADLPPAPDAGGDDRSPSRRWWGRRSVTALLVVLALVPLLASVAAVAPGWLPVGDDATIAMRGRDLFTDEMPLLGMPSAVGAQTERPVHHPGPLQLWWVGAWERGLDVGQASLLAAAAAWGAATAAALLLARRVGGTPLLALAAVITALLTWSLRGEVPVTPFNAHAIVIPLGAYLLALVAWHQRVRGAGLAAIVLGSWSAQAHLTAVGPVAVAGAVVVIAVGLRRLRSVTRVPVGGRPIAVGAAVLAACWVGPVVDVVTNDGGNLREVLGARSDLASEAIGLDTAVDIVVRALAFRPVWASAGAHPAELVAAADLQHWMTAIAVLAIAAVGAIRQRHAHPALGVAVAATIGALATGSVLAGRFPGDYLSSLALHNYLWLWPLTAVLWGLAVVVVGLEVRDAVGPGGTARWLAPGATVLAAAVLVAVGIVSLGEPHRSLALSEPTYVRALGDGAIDRLDPERPYRVVISGEFDEYFVEAGLLAYLEDAGLDVVGPARLRRTFGDDRTTPDGPLAGELTVHVAWDEGADGVSGEALARYRPPPELVEERQAVEDGLVDLVREHPDDLPLWGMDGSGDEELRRWLREDLDAFVLAGLVPDWLADAPETDRYLHLRREAVLHASLRLVPAPG